MTKIKSILVALLIFVTIEQSFSQMIYWTTPPKKYSMSPTTPTSVALPGGASTYSVANGAYDPNGNLLFYVQDNGIYNASGTYVNQLGDYIPNPLFPTEGKFTVCSEISIVPVPGSCKNFYVIYAKDNPVGDAKMMYTKVDCSSGSPVITYNGSPIGFMNPNPPNNWISSEQAFFINGHTGADHIGFAVSKVYVGTGSTSKRFLYTVNDNAGFIGRSEISSSGISAASTVVSAATLGLSGVDFSSYEAELSWGSNCIAWAANGKVQVIRVTPSTGAYVSSSLQTYSSGFAGSKGVEFNNATTNPKLYVSCTAGIKQILTSNQSVTTVSTSSYSLTNTYLEYGKNNKIYGISPVYSGLTLTSINLVGINMTNNSITAVANAGFDSRYVISGSYVNGVFTLPDQIDGEIYTIFTGMPNVTIAAATLNGSGSTGDCENTPLPVYYNCTPLIFNATYNNGLPTRYKFDIQALDANCQLITGGVNYHGSWTAGQPAPNLNLFTLTGTFTGNVQVQYSIEDTCGNVSTITKNINIQGPPASANSVFKLYDGNGNSSFASTTTCVSPYALCQVADGGIYAQFSTGSVCYYNVKLERLTGACPNGFTNLGTTGDFSVTACNPANIAPKTMNSIGNSLGLGTSYFDQPGNLNTTYRITVTVGNACGSNSSVGYFNPSNGGCRLAYTSIDDVSATGFNISPNPANDRVNVEFYSASKMPVTFQIYDISGRRVAEYTNIKVDDGFNSIPVDVSSFESGVYFIQMNSDKQSIKKLIVE